MLDSQLERAALLLVHRVIVGVFPPPIQLSEWLTRWSPYIAILRAGLGRIKNWNTIARQEFGTAKLHVTFSLNRIDMSMIVLDSKPHRLAARSFTRLSPLILDSILYDIIYIYNIYDS